MGVALVLAAPAIAADHISLWPDTPAEKPYEAPADARRGGTLRLAAIGSYDTLNPYTLKGDSAAGLDMVFEPLMRDSLTQPDIKYAWIAKDIQVDLPSKQVTFTLDPRAHWADKTPISAADVVFTFNTLKTKGHPFYRSYMKDVQSAKADGASRVIFTLATDKNRELPFILAGLPVLPKKDWDGRDFAATTLQKPLGSGPYQVAEISAPRRITYTRNDNWWAKDLPASQGKYNFDTITYDYYRDASVALQALFAGAYDMRAENIAKEWATAYNAKPVRDGLIKKVAIPNQIPAGMQSFVFNLRRAKFQDRRVRRALSLAFDFEWGNSHVAFNSYKRTESFFANSDLASSGLPSPDEIKLLEPYRDQLPPELFTSVYRAPSTDGSGLNRDNLRQAQDLLKEAGYESRGDQLVHSKTGKPLSFEILTTNDAFERWVLPYQRNLQKIGVSVNLRVVDPSIYQRRQDQFDYDMIIGAFPQSTSPGNEQRDFWSSAVADTPGSRNLIGLKNPAVDALVDKIIAARTREELLTACHALDRVLLWGYYVIPQWHIGAFRLAYWDRFGMPEQKFPYALPIVETWWVKGDETSRAKPESQVN